MVAIPHDLEQRLEPLSGPVPRFKGLEGFSSAAVVALILPSVPGGPHDQERLVLIERASSMPTHPGQLAFPGGKEEPDDASLMRTALREAEEEVGLDAGDATVLGRLLPVPTPTKFVIYPFVALARPGWEPRATSREVAQLVTPTVAELADPDVHRITGTGDWMGYRYELHEFRIHDPPLWGATARMTWDLLQRLQR